MKTRYLFITICVAGLTLLATSCGGSKKVATMDKDSDMVEQIDPFVGSEYQTDKKFFRAVAQGVSTDRTIAEKIAIQNAKTAIAGDIQSVVQEATKQYLRNHGIDEVSDAGTKFQAESVIAVQQVLSNVVNKGKKLYKSKSTNQYTCFVALEMAHEDIGKSLGSRISQEAKDRLDFDEYQFNKEFDKAMELFNARK
ncbi:MAG: hypothetical protein LBF90_01870 [Prevotellaceae bacterium]|jgi:hypothetical protein|nr:hypothetical protein [Prevotellaceae bacterium]